MSVRGHVTANKKKLKPRERNQPWSASNIQLSVVNWKTEAGVPNSLHGSHLPLTLSLACSPENEARGLEKQKRLSCQSLAKICKKLEINLY